MIKRITAFPEKVASHLLVCLLLCVVAAHSFGQGAKEGKLKPNSLKVSVKGFRYVSISGSTKGVLIRKMLGSNRKEYGLTDAEVQGKIVGMKTAFSYTDTVPVTLGETSYQYTVVDANDKETAASAATEKAWPEQLFPGVLLPKHANWAAVYKKAWQLQWQRMVTSAAMPSRFSHNDYPDNNINYVWDACFNSLFQCYGSVSGALPGIVELDNFYAQQAPSGYILRHYHWPTYGSGGRAKKDTPRLSDVNPPLFAWAEWNNYRITGDSSRFRTALPVLVKYTEFLDTYLEESPGKYIWNDFASGWDNMKKAQKHKYWIDLLSTQALAARYISKMAGVLGEKQVEQRFAAYGVLKGKELNNYWNKDKNWYCSVGFKEEFTGKTINGMWPVLSGYVPKENLELIVSKNLFNPQTFYTTMPLPTLAKDEKGYNPEGEYWLGSVWINTSSIAIRGLNDQGLTKEAFQLAERTVEGMATVYRDWKPQPNTIWECYAPEFPAPASHKDKPGLGSVRGEFAGWSCGVINLLIENVMGFQVDAPANTIRWNINLNEDFGIERLVFGKIKTNIQLKGNAIIVQADASYTLIVARGGKERRYQVKKGSNRFKV